MTGGEKAGSFSKFNFLNTQIFLNITLMVMQRGGCVYIITNKNNSVLYTGVTSDIIGRIFDHKNKTYPQSFTAKYNCNKLT
ncbi:MULTISPECIES: GIY-YIG nuclease family protein [Mucilaginibacter]|nr:MULTISPECIES: GIY-YIG nuclease family protein [Mucilaginibacter]